MKEFLLAGALLHTFTVAPQPTVRKANQQNTLQYTLQYQLNETLKNENETQTMLIYKAKTNIGILTCDLYKIETYIQNSGEWNTVIYGEFAKTTPVSLNTVTINQPYIATTGDPNGYYYRRYGHGTNEMSNAMQNPTFNGINTAVENYLVEDDLEYATVETNSGSTEVNYTYNNQDQFSFMFVIENDDDLFYLFDLTETNIIYTYTYSTDNVGEIVDIGGLLWNILAMPFAFISTAFNLTIFPGTAYAVNISNVLMTLIACLVVIWVIRRFTR